MIWFRVHYASGRSEAVLGKAALEHALARKTPRVILHEVALIFRCQVCGELGPWGPGWIGWTRYHERHQLRGDGDDIYCSEACARAENPLRHWPDWMNVHDEPRPPAHRRALYEARWEERKRKRSTTDHRKVPMPEYPGRGHCTWCAGKLDPAVDGRRLSWHETCLGVYFLHTRLDNQFAFLKERDGPVCAWPDCEITTYQGLEVDHKVPLWSVDQTLPLEELRWFYGPGNLWLLCGPHHKAKTKREAAERAAQRRFNAAQRALPL